jgi:hypothetical protein
MPTASAAAASAAAATQSDSLLAFCSVSEAGESRTITIKTKRPKKMK